MSLAQELAKQREVSHRRIPEDKWTLMQRAAEDLAQSGIEEKSLKIGDISPDFALPNAFGKLISLAEMLKNGPVVLSFYRGGW